MRLFLLGRCPRLLAYSLSGCCIALSRTHVIFIFIPNSRKSRDLSPRPTAWLSKCVFSWGVAPGCNLAALQAAYQRFLIPKSRQSSGNPLLRRGWGGLAQKGTCLLPKGVLTFCPKGYLPFAQRGTYLLPKGVLAFCLKGYLPFAQRGDRLLPKRVRPFCLRASPAFPQEAVWPQGCREQGMPPTVGRVCQNGI